MVKNCEKKFYRNKPKTAMSHPAPVPNSPALPYLTVGCTLFKSAKCTICGLKRKLFVFAKSVKEYCTNTVITLFFK
jgi:hypothetical protein